MRILEVKQTVHQTVQKDFNATKQVIRNVCEFVDAACLAGVSGFAIYTALKHNGRFWYEVLLFAGLVIALQAFVLLVKHFNYEK